MLCNLLLKPKFKNLLQYTELILEITDSFLWLLAEGDTDPHQALLNAEKVPAVL